MGEREKEERYEGNKWKQYESMNWKLLIVKHGKQKYSAIAGYCYVVLSARHLQHCTSFVAVSSDYIIYCTLFSFLLLLCIVVLWGAFAWRIFGRWCCCFQPSGADSICLNVAWHWLQCVTVVFAMSYMISRYLIGTVLYDLKISHIVSICSCHLLGHTDGGSFATTSREFKRLGGRS